MPFLGAELIQFRSESCLNLKNLMRSIVENPMKALQFLAHYQILLPFEPDLVIRQSHHREVWRRVTRGRWYRMLTSGSAARGVTSIQRS